MPLHLLHHKSYHVYSAANIERVRRDEAAAKAKEEAEEQRMQEVDAERRIQLLRQRAAGAATDDYQGISIQRVQAGEQAAVYEVPTFGSDRKTGEGQEDKVNSQLRSRSSGNSRLNISERARNGAPDTIGIPSKRHCITTTGSHASIYGSDGHINLFASLEDSAAPSSLLRRAEKNPEHEAEKRAKEEKLEAQFTMALGKPADELRPWYSTLDKVGEKQEQKTEKQTEWEKKKEERRKEWGDPLAGMRKGARAVREVEQSRKKWKMARDREMNSLPNLDLDLPSKSDREPASKGIKEWRRDGEERKRSRSRNRDREHQKRRDGSHEADGHKRSRYHRSEGRRYNHSSRKRRRDSSANSDIRHYRRRHGRSRSRSPRRYREKQRLSKSPRRHRRSTHKERDDDAAIEKLRVERDRRESAERDKAVALIRGDMENRIPGWKPVEGGRYSKQFGVGDIRK